MTTGQTPTVAMSQATSPTVLRSVASLPSTMRSDASLTPVLSVAVTSAPVLSATSSLAVSGGSGNGNASAFTHTQTTASSAWVVYHQLGTRPIVEIIINNEAQIGRVTYPNTDSVLIEFNAPVAGIAKCVG